MFIADHEPRTVAYNATGRSGQIALAQRVSSATATPPIAMPDYQALVKASDAHKIEKSDAGVQTDGGEYQGHADVRRGLPQYAEDAHDRMTPEGAKIRYETSLFGMRILFSTKPGEWRCNATHIVCVY